MTLKLGLSNLDPRAMYLSLLSLTNTWYSVSEKALGSRLGIKFKIRIFAYDTTLFFSIVNEPQISAVEVSHDLKISKK